MANYVFSIILTAVTNIFICIVIAVLYVVALLSVGEAFKIIVAHVLGAVLNGGYRIVC